MIALWLLLHGCAYQKFMEQGARLEAAGDWDGAIDQYGLALEERPGDPEAAARVERLRERKADAAVARAEEAMERADYEAAMAALAEVEAIDDDRPEVYVLRARAEEELRQAFQGFLAAGQRERAYVVADRYIALFGRKTWLNVGLAELRAQLQRRASEAAAAGHYPQALELLALIARHEPDREDALASQRHAIRTAWADRHAAIASELLRGGQIGGAALSWLRAWEIAERPTDRRAAERLLERLRQEGALSYRVDLRDPDDRALADALGAVLAGLVPTRELHRSPALIVELAPSVFHCEEQVERSPRSTPYPAGTVQVPNPPWVEANREVEAKERELQGVKRKQDALWVVMGELTDRLAVHEGELVELLSRKPGLEARVEQARHHRDEAAAVGAPSLSAWEAELLARQAELDEVEERLARLQRERAPLQEELTRAERELRALLATIPDLEADIAGLVTARDAHPRTVAREVEDTFHWELERWTRTCVGELTVRASPSWPTSLPVQERVRHEARTEDEAHVGNPAAGVEPDPKRYPKTDAELRRDVEAQHREALRPWLEAWVDEHFQVRTTAVAIQLAEDPRRATTEALRLFLGAPERLRPEARSLIESRLRDAWELEGELAALTAGDPPPRTP